MGFDFTFHKRNLGCPVLAFFARAGTMLSIQSQYHVTPSTLLWRRTPALYHVLVLPANASSQDRFEGVRVRERFRFEIARLEPSLAPTVWFPPFAKNAKSLP